MIYRQIGNGGAFDTNMPNSSFVIGNDGQYLLFDCGYNIFTELKRLDEELNENFSLTKLNSVYISHMDDDHVGSLKTLIYYQYFINNAVMDIYASGRVFVELCLWLYDVQSEMVDGKVVGGTLCNLIEVTEDTYKKININGMKVIPTVTDHHVACHGLIVDAPVPGGLQAIYITGDTKALSEIRNIIENIDNIYRKYKVFHDYSHWDCEGSQVHACKSDVDKKYSETTKSRISWYHTGTPFDNKWKQL